MRDIGTADAETLFLEAKNAEHRKEHMRWLRAVVANPSPKFTMGA